MKYKVVGFNDEVQKYRGPAQRFKEEHCFVTGKLPTEAELLEFATALGYNPHNVSGVDKSKCEPMYLILEDDSGSVLSQMV